MQRLGLPAHPAPTIGDPVIRAAAMDFTPARVVGIACAGGMLQVVYADGSGLAAPADEFLVVPATWRPPPPRRLSRVQQLELMYDDEIPPGLIAAAEAEDTAPAMLAARRDEAAAWLTWLATHLHPLDPARFAEPLARAQAALTAAAMAEPAAA
jgi:hypothetical protein